MDGCFEVWDLLQQFNDKVVMIKISDCPILCSRAHKNGKLVTVGTSCGDIYQVEVSANLTNSGSNERSSFLAMLERETKRERLLESKHREIKLKEKESERVRLLDEEVAIENAIAEEVLIQHAETAFMQLISGDQEKVKIPVSYLDLCSDEILMDTRNNRSHKFKF
jgi:dynein intermediate chain 2, axonemal